MKCSKCGKDNPLISWCADADYGSLDLNEFEGYVLGMTTCNECGEYIKIKILKIEILKEDVESVEDGE